MGVPRLNRQIVTNRQFLSCQLLDSNPEMIILRSAYINAYLLWRPSVGHEPTQFSPVFSIDVSAERSSVPHHSNVGEMTVALLHQVVIAQQKQNQLLEQLVNATVSAQKQRATELQQWKDANPRLAQSCRRAAEMLSKVQADFLQSLTDEIDDSEEALNESDYMLHEFVDRVGPRLAHLNGVLQVLAQLGSGVPAQQQ